MMRKLTGLAVFAVALAAGSARAAGVLAVARPETAATAVLEVSSRAFEPNTSLPIMYAREGKSISPPLAWTGAPVRTRSFAVICEDPDAPGAEPFVHWLIYDVDGTSAGLPRAVKVGPEPRNAGGARQGRNALGTVGYSGPTPPEHDPPHHYHFEVFALDRRLKLKAGAGRDELLRAVAGHVIAQGEIVGLYQRHPPKAEIPMVTPLN